MQYKPKLVYVLEEEWIEFVAKHKSASKRIRELVKADLEERIKIQSLEED